MEPRKLYMLTDGQHIKALRMMDQDCLSSAQRTSLDATDGIWAWEEVDEDQLIPICK